MGKPSKKKSKVRFKMKMYVGNESTRKEMMLKEARQRADSLQHVVDSLKHENDSLKVVIENK